MMTAQSDDVLNHDILSNPKAVDAQFKTSVGVVEQETQRPLAGKDDSARQRNTRHRGRLRKQFDASADIGHASMSALSAFSGGTELYWDWD